MTKDTFYKQAMTCRADGVATPDARNYELLKCTRYGGDCQMMKCIEAHEKG